MGNLDRAIVERIGRAVDDRRDALVEMVRALVRVPSITGEEAAVQDVVERVLRSRGLVVDRWTSTDAELAPYRDSLGPQPDLDRRPNLVGRRAGAGGGRSLLLNAHVDTVPPGERSDWTHDPFAGEVADGRIYGRGACDMKDALATYLVALDALDAAGVPLRGDVLVSASAGEEAGGVGAVSTMLRGHRADAAVISEPTGLRLVPAHAGIMPLRVEVRGRAAHAAVRDEGVSAFEMFLPVFAALRELERARNAALRHPLYERVANKIPISFGTIRAGVWRSSVPDLLVAEGRVGMLPGEDPAEVRRQVEAAVAAAAANDPWLRDHPPVVTWYLTTLPADVPADEPIARAVAAAHRAVTGGEVAVEGVPYAADMVHFIRLGGIPCVLYGAGDIRVCHFADEHVPIDDLVTATKVIACLIADWAG